MIQERILPCGACILGPPLPTGRPGPCPEAGGLKSTNTLCETSTPILN